MQPLVRDGMSSFALSLWLDGPEGHGLSWKAFQPGFRAVSPCCC